MASQVDEVESYFGMRKIALGKDADGIPRLMLNNQPLFQFGPLDQGFWPDGIYTAPTDEALRYDIEMTKELGMQHGPQARQDRAGPLVLLVRQARPARLAGHARQRQSATTTTDTVRPGREDAAKQFETETEGA